MERSNPKTWRAMLTPHRSLSRQGFVAGDGRHRRRSIWRPALFFCLIGAWPVVGFMGLDVALDLVGLPGQFRRCPAAPSGSKSPSMNWFWNAWREGRARREQPFRPPLGAGRT